MKNGACDSWLIEYSANIALSWDFNDENSSYSLTNTIYCSYVHSIIAAIPVDMEQTFLFVLMYTISCMDHESQISHMMLERLGGSQTRCLCQFSVLNACPNT